VLFPLEAVDGDESAAQTALPIPAAEQMHGMLLLVEDEEQVLAVASRMMSRLGFTIIEASNGIEALEAYQKHSAEIKLVITDIGMPLMDGHELIQKLKLLNPALPIIVTSGFNEQMITARTPGSDIAGIINKPFSFSRLKEVLMKFTDDLPPA
jgi:CheY-like chemotaxis protein